MRYNRALRKIKVISISANEDQTRTGRYATHRNYGAERLVQANQAPRCGYVKSHGGPCRGAAVRGREMCRFHNIAHNTAAYDYQVPLLEDAASIQFGFMQVIRALQDKVYDTKTCGLMLYALQLASSNLRRMNEESEREAEVEAAEQAANVPQPDLVSDMLKRLGLYDAADERRERLREEGSTAETQRHADPSLCSG